MKSFQVHSGPAYSCSWHPENDMWLASAGRDKTIKVKVSCPLMGFMFADLRIDFRTASKCFSSQRSSFSLHNVIGC